MHSDYKFYKEKRAQLDTEHSKRISAVKNNLETIEKSKKRMEEKLNRIQDYVRGFGVTSEDVNERMKDFGMKQIAPLVDQLCNIEHANRGLQRELQNTQTVNHNIVHNIQINNLKRQSKTKGHTSVQISDWNHILSATATNTIANDSILDGGASQLSSALDSCSKRKTR